MALVKTPRAYIDVLDANGNITGHEVELWLTYEPEGPDDPMAGQFTPKMIREPIDPAILAEARKTSDTGILADSKKAHARTAELQALIETKDAEHSAAIQAAAATVQNVQTSEAAARAELATLGAKVATFLESLKAS